MDRHSLLSGVLALALSPRLSFADNQADNQPLLLAVPFPLWGTTDVMARVSRATAAFA